MREGASGHRADHELRGHHATVEPRTKRDRDQQRFPEKPEIGHGVAAQRLVHQRQAQAQVAGRDGQDQQRQHHAAQQRRQRGPQPASPLQLAESLVHPVHQFDEQPGHRAAQHADRDGLQEQQLGKFADEGDVVMRIGHAEKARHLECRHARDDAGKQKIVADATDGQHLDAVDGPGDGRAEHAGETGADAAGEQALAHLRVQVQHAADARGEAGADVRAWPFLAGRTAAAERDQRGQGLDPEGSERHAALLLVDRDDGIVLVTALPEPVAVVQQQAVGETGQRQQQHLRPQRRVIGVAGGREQQVQEDGATDADERPGEDRQRQPLRHGREHHQGLGKLEVTHRHRAVSRAGRAIVPRADPDRRAGGVIAARRGSREIRSPRRSIVGAHLGATASALCGPRAHPANDAQCFGAAGATGSKLIER